MKITCEFIILKTKDSKQVISVYSKEQMNPGSYLEIQNYPSKDGLYMGSGRFQESPDSLKLRQIGRCSYRRAECTDMSRHNLLSDCGSFIADPTLSLHDLETAYMTHVLSLCDGNRVKAAKILGISLKTLYNRLVRSKENV